MKAKIRNALVTWNNPPTKDWDDLVAMLNPAYMVGQLERGEAGTLHWQFAVQWQNPRSFAAIKKKDLPLAHFEEVRSWAAAVTYCQKADTRDSGPWEFGTRPTGGSGKAQAEDWETWYQLAAEGKFRKFPPKFKSSTWAIWSAFTARISNSSTKQMCAESGFWGAPGVGKSHFARQVLGAEGYYLSSTISGGTAIRARRSSSWRTLTRKRSSSFTTTSRFGRTAGVHWRDQGGAVAPIHRWLVVTSNYSIMDILNDLEDRQLRRPSLVGSCGLRCSAATRSRTGTPTRPSPPRLWPPSLNE